MNNKMIELLSRMRKDAKDDDYTPDGILGQKLNWYADKIEEIAEEPADRQITPPDEGVFLRNHAAAIESLNHIVYWAGAAARSLPARNCDTMDHFEMLAKRFKEEVCDQYDNDWEDSRTQCPHDCVRCVMKWMTTRKGEDFEGL